MLGTRTGCSPSIISSRTNRSASRRSVLTRSLRRALDLARRRDHALHAGSCQRARERVPGRSGLIGHLRRARQRRAERRRPRSSVPASRRTRISPDSRSSDRRDARSRVHIKTSPTANLCHVGTPMIAVAAEATILDPQPAHLMRGCRPSHRLTTAGSQRSATLCAPRARPTPIAAAPAGHTRRPPGKERIRHPRRPPPETPPTTLPDALKMQFRRASPNDGAARQRTTNPTYRPASAARRRTQASARPRSRTSA